MNKIFLVNTDISFIDYPSAEEHAVIVYFSGCSHNCTNCHNQQLQFHGIGKEYTIDELLNHLIYECNRNKTNNVVFSGGDPLFSKNIEFVKEFLFKYYRRFNICIYTGYDIEYVKKHDIKGFKYIKCGVFKNSLKQESGNFEDRFQLASTNQNFYDENYNQISEKGILYYID